MNQGVVLKPVLLIPSQVRQEHRLGFQLFHQTEQPVLAYVIQVPVSRIGNSMALSVLHKEYVKTLSIDYKYRL